MVQERLYYGEIESPFGPLIVVHTKQGVCRILFGTFEKNESTLNIWIKKNIGKAELVKDKETNNPVYIQLIEYFEGQRQSFDLKFDLYGTLFEKKVWQALLNIGYGKTYSYRELAQVIQSPKAVRAVGCAVNKNPLPIIVPCHRIVGSNGSLVCYHGGIDKKQMLLEMEYSLEEITS
ncbi:methylated-DNA--[protein]-cysteine S-methyltransferase [Bacillus solimangrovi]|uniref:Methylated-DNA--protein-cysteine methyltransferase n=1 Tax=Bacillus solimangrovi TaxID=1305675 RepID=A0A1E5LC61_9BACI|nr:methylated-DNA--[protein]-cysteine S-methyltransferase [Bacillus solimangrovi]OEH91688.1 [Fe-S]-binding protein [Bacillus solimangrovi]